MFGPEYFNTVGYRVGDCEIVCEECYDRDPPGEGEREGEEIKEADVSAPCAYTCDECGNYLVDYGKGSHRWEDRPSGAGAGAPLVSRCADCDAERTAESKVREGFERLLSEGWTEGELESILESVALQLQEPDPEPADEPTATDASLQRTDDPAESERRRIENRAVASDDYASAADEWCEREGIGGEPYTGPIVDESEKRRSDGR